MASLRAKFLLCKLLVVLGTVLLLGTISYDLMVDSLVTAQEEKLTYVAETSAKSIDGYLRDVGDRLQRIETAGYHRTREDLLLAQQFARVEETFPILSYLNGDGREEVRLVRGRKELPRDDWNPELFQRAIERPNRVVFSPVQLSAELGEPVIYAAHARFLYFGNEYAGTLMAAIPLSSFEEIYDETPFGESGFRSLLSAGRILLHPDPGLRLSELNTGDRRDDAVIEALQGRRSGFFRSSILGADSYLALAPVQALNLHVAAVLPHDEFMIPPNRLKAAFLIACTFILAASLGASFLFTSKLTGHIRRLMEHTRHLAGGDFTRTIHLDSGDEMECLGQSFNQMTECLRRLTTAKESLNAIVESIIDPLIVTEEGGRIAGVNPSALRLFDYPKSELIGRPLEELFAPHEAIFRDPGLWKVLESGPVRNYETEIRTREGKLVPVLFSCSLSESQSGGEGLVALIKDISNRKQAELARIRALRESEEARDKIDAILNSVLDGLIVTDVEGRIILMNPAAEKILGSRLELALGESVREIAGDAPLRNHLLGSDDGANLGKPVDLELFDHGRQEMRVFQVRTSPVASRDRVVTGLITLLRDVTQDRQVDRLKNEFISTAAHELRTPLTSILGFSEFLLYPEEFGGFDEEQRREFLAEIFEKAQTLSRIVNELLDISRIESGQAMSLDPSPCQVEEMVTRMIRNYRIHAPRHRFEVDLERIEEEVWVDPGKFIQIMENLLSNAVKYSPEGGTIRVRGKRTEDSVRLIVEDEGIGMTPEQTARIFDKFYRVDSSNTAVGGLGLGMSIVRTIVYAHGGTIWVESTPGAGTRVHFTLPLGCDLTKEGSVQDCRPMLQA